MIPPVLGESTLNIAKVLEAIVDRIPLQWECSSPVAHFGFPVHPTKLRPDSTEKNIVWQMCGNMCSCTAVHVNDGSVRGSLKPK